MKTNQIIIRPMGDFKVIQRTKDAFFNATDLLKQWNEQIDNQSILNTQKIGVLKRKDLDNYLNRRNSAYLSSREKNGLGEFSPKIDNQVVIRI